MRMQAPAGDPVPDVQIGRPDRPAARPAGVVGRGNGGTNQWEGKERAESYEMH